jgi:hypothetical protein
MQVQIFSGLKEGRIAKIFLMSGFTLAAKPRNTNATSVFKCNTSYWQPIAFRFDIRFGIAVAGEETSALSFGKSGVYLSV